jgi:hypothetical protein
VLCLTKITYRLELIRVLLFTDYFVVFALKPTFCMQFQTGKIDWDKIQIDDNLDDEGRLEFTSEEQVYTMLGLKEEDDREKQERERRTDGAGHSNAEKGCDRKFMCNSHLPTPFEGKKDV